MLCRMSLVAGMPVLSVLRCRTRCLQVNHHGSFCWNVCTAWETWKYRLQPLSFVHEQQPLNPQNLDLSIPLDDYQESRVDV
mmetsp:Transcript_12340/g.22420  ORF Transcript_12340/g.22420 Transcript_12340/m.22420 type:complete len:81 (-) Transcript_12340:208-450(-)